MPQTAGNPGIVHRVRKQWIVISLLSVLAILVSLAGYRLYEEVSLLRSAPRDNVQWTTSQLEVDTIRLHLAIEYARAGEGTLESVRRRFDIFYSRVRLISRSRIFNDLLETPLGRKAIADLELFLNDVTPLIDSPDPELRAALATIDQRLSGLTDASRALAVGAIQYFAAVSDAERERFVQVLTLASGGGVLMIGLLAFLLMYIDGQHRQVASRSAEVERSRRLLTAINDAALDAIVVADSDGKVIGWNEAAVRIFGYSEEEAVGASLADLIIPEQYRAAHEAGMKRYLKSGEKRVVDSGRIELSALRKDGAKFPVELAIAASESDQSPIFIAYLRDISARRAAQRELLEARDAAMAADRTKSEFLAVMSHEMRTPLNGVLGVLELMQSTPLDERQRRYIDTAVFSGEVLLRHINDVLDLSRIDAGKMTYEREVLDLPEIVSQVLEIGRTCAEANGNRVEASIGPGLTGLIGDAHRIRQVLLNLVGNAGKFTHNGRILVSAAAISGEEETVEVELAVTDSGIGIPEKDRANIFEDFITLDSAFNRSNTGSGLGLAICRRIVRGMGGRIGVADGFGGGSRFWVRLPLERAKFSPPQRQPTETAAAPVGGCHVLIVEDNDINRMVVGEMLRSAGHKVSEAHKGQEGVAVAENELFDLIFMDISMPGIDGIETTRRIRAGTGVNAETPIIGLTAHVMPEVRDAVIAAGMQDCLSKPVRRNEMQSIIANYGAPGASIAVDMDCEDETGLPIIDDEVFADLAESLPPKLFHETLTKAVQQIDSLSERLSGLETCTDLPALAEEVHKVSGAAALIGASRLHDFLSTLEWEIRNEKLSGTASIPEKASDIFSETKGILLEYT